MIETVLTIQKTVNNLFGVNPFFGPNLTILLAIFVVIRVTMKVTVEKKKQHALQLCHELLMLKVNVTA